VFVDDAAARRSPQPNSRQQFFFRPGQMVASRYSVLNVIGRGGMGCIYRVQDNVLKEEVALKTLLPQFVSDKMVVERFLNEARIARGLSHPNIVRVHDIGVTNNIIYISMELVKGKSLRAMLDDVPPGQRLPARTSLHIIDELCAALEYAHHQTVHRDIKPENVMVRADGAIKLMDFGISKLVDHSLTGASMVMGTPFYMSPEQLKNSANVDARSDIYSVGVMMYEILTGIMPTGIPKPASQLAREVPIALDQIVSKCVEPDPDNRYQSATELRAALRPLLEILDSGTALPDRPLRREKTGGSLVKRVAGVVVVIGILAATVAGLRMAEKYRKENAAVVEVDARPGPAPEAKALGDVAKVAEDWRISFKKLTDKVSRERSSMPPEASIDVDMSRVLDAANARWELAQTEAGQDNPKAVELGRAALECFRALRSWEHGMVFIPPGEVTIVDDGESSVVAVDGFFIDRLEVTNRQYLEFCDSVEGGWRLPSYDLRSAPGEAPVVDVTFYDALGYAAWAGKQLPTEAQWARAAYGDKTASDHYPWGADWEAGACNSGADENSQGVAAQGGSFKRDLTWSGCYDMAGNVSEWTRTAFKELPYDSADGRDDSASFTFGTLISVRGGNLRETEGAMLNARFSFSFESHDFTLGFRCVKSAPEDED
jgi:formylglycine-generating enzyme required for sulfatase activity/tRNA A-37 threonylcarbamoyl transferase component Bud32